MQDLKVKEKKGKKLDQIFLINLINLELAFQTNCLEILVDIICFYFQNFGKVFHEYNFVFGKTMSFEVSPF